MELINFKGNDYPKLQSEGFASQYAFPFAKKLLSGLGVDVGCMKREWAFEGAIPVDIDFDNGYHAAHLPEGLFNYIFSSHCLEHIPTWVDILRYWHSKLYEGGTLFLYLPNMDYQVYWRCWHNRKHFAHLNPSILKMYFEDNQDMWDVSFVTEGYDLNGSFYAVATKK